MSQPEPSSSSSFQDLFNDALQNYQIQTGTELIKHPLAKQLELCDSVDSIIAILQDQAHIFREFGGDNGKVMKSVKYSVNTLYTLSIGHRAVGLVHIYYLLIFLVSNCHPTAIPACECSIRWHRHLTCRRSLLGSHLHITVTSKSCRLSKTSVLSTTHSLTCLRHSRTFSADSVSIPWFLLRQHCQTF